MYSREQVHCSPLSGICRGGKAVQLGQRSKIGETGGLGSSPPLPETSHRLPAHCAGRMRRSTEELHLQLSNVRPRPQSQKHVSRLPVLFHRAPSGVDQTLTESGSSRCPSSGASEVGGPPWGSNFEARPVWEIRGLNFGGDLLKLASRRLTTAVEVPLRLAWTEPVAGRSGR